MTWKKVKDWGLLLFTPLHDNEIILKIFFCEGTNLKLETVHMGVKFSLRNTSPIQHIELSD